MFSFYSPSSACHYYGTRRHLTNTNLNSAQVQILLKVCLGFVAVKTFDKKPGQK